MIADLPDPVAAAKGPAKVQSSAKKGDAFLHVAGHQLEDELPRDGCRIGLEQAASYPQHEEYKDCIKLI